MNDAPPVVATVWPDVDAIGRPFHYLVPAAMVPDVRVGTIVRVVLHGRRVRGWVVALGEEPPAGVALRPLARVTGWGPPGEVIELARWAAWRWAGPLPALLGTASPPGVVRALPSPSQANAAPAVRGAARPAAGPDADPAPVADTLAAALSGAAVTVVCQPPASPRLDVVLAAARRGPTLVLCPTAPMARAAAQGLRANGIPVAEHPRDWARGAAGATVVGTRAAAWAPVGGLSAVVVIDEHDEAHAQQAAPTWNARDVAVERARRAGVPCLLVSPCPSLEALAAGAAIDLPGDRRRGWPAVTVVDRREEEPGRPAVSAALADLVRGPGRVLCVLNRTGRARLLGCAACGELARCERCDAALAQPDEDRLVCPRCGQERPVVCAACGATRLKVLRSGVTRLRGELEALVREPVDEVTATTPVTGTPSRVLVGTEAVLRQVPGADAVAFVDLDQELAAPRYRAAEQALGLLARAARVVGAGRPAVGGRAHGRLLLQTRMPDHEVVQAVVRAEPERVARVEARRRAELGFPPARALAALSGPGAAEMAATLRAAVAGVAGGGDALEVLGPADGTWLVRAPDHRVLADALAGAGRPAERVRVEVDPLRV